MGNTLQFSVGYNQRLLTNKSSTVTIVESFNNNEQYLTDLATSTGDLEFGTGLNINADYIWQRESGWRNIFGLSLFMQKEIDVLTLLRDQDQPVLNDLEGFDIKGGYLTSRLGLGYIWYKPKSASWFVNGLVLIGGGWSTDIRTSYYHEGPQDEYSIGYTMNKSTIGNGLFLGYGLQFEFGGYIPINKRWMFVATIQSSIYFTGYRSWYSERGLVVNDDYQPVFNSDDNPELFIPRKVLFFQDRYHNIGFSMGVNYKL